MSDPAPYVIDLNESADVQTERYWRVVRRTVDEVFQGHGQDVQPVRNRLAGQSKGTQEKFYQTEPYTVAADIAGKSGAGSARQRLRYLRIKADEQYGPVDIPEDLGRAAGHRSRR